MPRSKAFDQTMLLLTAVVFIILAYWLVSFMEHRGIPDRMGFFIAFNLGVGFVLTWQGIAFFRRTPKFWLFHGCWAIVHICVYGIWGYSGNRIELCAFTLLLEAYLYYRIAKGRFLRSLEASSLAR
jgi:hypothetical protein